MEADLREFRDDGVVVVGIGREGAALDAGGSRGEEAEVGFVGEDDGVGAEVSCSESGRSLMVTILVNNQP